MVCPTFSPMWFNHYGIMLEILFAIITMVIAFFAFRIYKSTSQTQIKFFGLSFFVISLSYMIQAAFNIFVEVQANEGLCSSLNIYSIVFFDSLGLFAHMVFMIMGLSLLLYATLKTEKQRTFWLIFIMAILSMIFSRYSLFNFYLMSSLFLFFISWHFIANYFKNRNIKALLVAIAFSMLFFTNLHFLLSLRSSVFYVYAHLLEFIAYLLLIINFYLVRKNEPKKRQSRNHS